VVSGSRTPRLRVVGTCRLAAVSTVPDWHNLAGRAAAFSTTGAAWVSGGDDYEGEVWDPETGGCVHTLTGHQSLTSGMELRDNILVSGNADSTVRVWDIRTGQCLHTLQGPNKHQSAVTCLQFCRGLVLSSSDDGTVKLWDLRTGAWLRDVVALQSRGSGGVVWRIRASDTRLVCAAGSRNGTEETKLLVLDFDLDEKKKETD
ncbi:F-box/WD repeat-containing protein 7-like, partial [Astatotilapia calliptera]|uniref:F-box/WD repeat-containing protein 7-like n=1 Tax=Astatotilapia calliptera TaxID=8154 RepID=UPI000E402628